MVVIGNFAQLVGLRESVRGRVTWMSDPRLSSVSMSKLLIARV